MTNVDVAPRTLFRPKKPSVKKIKPIKYRFTATNSSGESVKGVEKAPTSRAVHAALLERGLRPDDVTLKVNRLRVSTTKKKVPRKEIANFSRQLAVFMKAGIPIMDALDVISREVHDETLESILQSIIASLKVGNSLSDAAAEHPKAFPAFYVAVLRSAELTGSLDTTLFQLSKYLDRDSKARSRITSALIYPMIVAVIGLATIVILSVFVLPRFVKFFKSLNAKLPLPTRMLMNVSAFTTKWSLEIVILAIIVVVGVVVMRRTESGMSLLDRLVLRLPVAGTITQTSILERTFRILGALLTSGVDLPLAMAVTAESANNSVYRKALEGIRAEVMVGHGLSDSVARTGLFPETAQQMFRVGEETGTLDRQLDDAAEYFGQELEIKIDRATALFEPAMIVAVGLVVGFVALALISAMYGIYSQVKVH
jgi:type IV pilus assembly protein PilC